MSLLRPETLRVAAQSVGVDELSDACVRELLPEVELRLREIIQDALKFRSHSKQSALGTQHINLALQTRNVESLYGFGAPGTVKYRQSDEHASLYFADDDELDLSEVLNAPLPQIPVQPTLNVHWLAVDGVQPLIPENESTDDAASRRTSIKDDAFVHRDVARKPLVKHVLTQEMQLYYTNITEAIKSDAFASQRAAFASLANDPGIHQLLPYFARFVYDEVKHSVHDLALLTSLMRVCRCLLVNQHLHVELYLHQLLPAILTCVLGKQLCENPADDHWALRKYAALLVAQICERFGDSYENIQPRVSQTYHKAITDASCPFTTQYGALYGMMYLGPLVMESLLFPNLAQYYKSLEPALAATNPNLVERLEAQNCLGILVHAAGTYFSMTQSRDRSSSSSSSDTAGLATASSTLLYDAFGERLVPYIRFEPTRSSGASTSMLDLCL